MRAIKAKRLRHIANHLTDGQATTYTQQEHKPKLVPTGRLNTHGLPEYMTITPITVKLSKGCQRAVYQELKKVG